jgi:hypothetical protein
MVGEALRQRLAEIEVVFNKQEMHTGPAIRECVIMAEAL